MAQATRYGQMTFSDHVEQALREGALWACLCVAVYLALSLMSYSDKDPCWSHVGETEIVTNAGGPAGAWFADIAFYLLGFFAYLLPFMLAWSAWTVFRGHGEEPALRVWLMVLRWLGFVVILAAGCGYLSLHVSTFGLRLPNGSGGGLGMLVKTQMLASFNAPGTDVLLTGALAVSIIVFSGISLLHLLDQFGDLLLRWMNSAFSKLGGTGKQPAAAPSDIAVFETAPAPAVKPVVTVPIAAGLPQTLKLLNPSEPPFDHTGKPCPVTPSFATPAPSAETEIEAPDITQKKTATAAASSSAAPEVESLPVARVSARPSLELLTASTAVKVEHSAEEIEELSCAVEAHLADLGLAVRVVAVYPGPVVTLFELQLPPGMKANKLNRLLPDLVRALEIANVRLVEMAPGHALIGIEIPNPQRQHIRLRELLDTPEYQKATAPLTIALGSNISGLPVVVDLTRLPHILLAGMTGAGKSVALNAMILSLLFKSSPKSMRLLLLDDGLPHFTAYAELPHLLAPVITEAPLAARALRWCIDEMERRYRLMIKLGVRNISGYNQYIAEMRATETTNLDFTAPSSEMPNAAGQRWQRLPYLVVVIAEVVELLEANAQTAAVLAHLTQKARAAGIHFILATAQPASTALTDELKTNLPTRIALQLASRTESRLIIEQGGAEHLLGLGDMLYLASTSNVPQRVHGALVTEDEVSRVVEFLQQQLGNWENQAPIASSLLRETVTETHDNAPDPLFNDAVIYVRSAGRASQPSLQRQFKISSQRAVRIIADMEQSGIIDAADHNGRHRVLASSTSQDQ
ncbi:hypothetical protein CKO09_05620 [Chromatium weissei]|nr:hypothetical protein [Chromatium weissei]